MIKDIFEDIQRHKSDNQENRRKVLVGDPKTSKFIPKLWQELHVGMIVKIKRDEYFPADLIIINSSGPKGICYIETKDLDGETNLKHKQADKRLLELDLNSEAKIIENMMGAYVQCENPNDMLYRFEGTLYI